jgi:hypothetical protein
MKTTNETQGTGDTGTNNPSHTEQGTPTTANTRQPSPPEKKPNETEKKPSENPDHTSPEKSKGPYAGDTTRNEGRNTNESNPGSTGNETGASNTFKPGFTNFSEGTDKSRSQDIEKGDSQTNSGNTGRSSTDKNPAI